MGAPEGGGVFGSQQGPHLEAGDRGECIRSWVLEGENVFSRAVVFSVKFRACVCVLFVALVVQEHIRLEDSGAFEMMASVDSRQDYVLIFRVENHQGNLGRQSSDPFCDAFDLQVTGLFVGTKRGDFPVLLISFSEHWLRLCAGILGALATSPKVPVVQRHPRAHAMDEDGANPRTAASPACKPPRTGAVAGVLPAGGYQGSCSLHAAGVGEALCPLRTHAVPV